MFYSPEDVADLIRSLDREEDGHLFADDVLRTYPYLAESYTKVCPQRCDLGTAVDRALEGYYSHDPKLSELRADIKLMVHNCIRFNGNNSPLAATAASFEHYSMQKLEAFVMQKTGSRRVSSLRLPKPAASEPAKAPARVGEGNEANSTTSPGRRDLVHLVVSLIRREDAGAFTVDVAEAYPDLREAYEAVCPVKMNLSMMKQRAVDGQYPTDLTGPTVADCLPQLRADVETIAANCKRFNAQVDAWVTRAHSFQQFAHRRIDDFVWRYAPQLRGTETGVERYGGAPQAGATGGDTLPPAPVSVDDDTRAAAEEPQVKRHRVEDVKSSPHRQQQAPPVLVQVVGDTVPSVEPMAVQPALEIPLCLHRRLVTDHLRRGQVTLRRVGATCQVIDLLPPPPKPAVEVDSDVLAVTAESAKHLSETNGEPPAGERSACVTVTPAMTGDAVLCAFRDSVHAFYDQQRRRTDFEDPFRYSLQEEALYDHVLTVLRAEYDRLLPRLLLYEVEAAQFHAWVAATSVQQSLGQSAERTTPVSWSRQLHLSYLVRLLVHFPQIASLCCATAAAPLRRGRDTVTQQSATHSGTQTVLKITKDSLAVLSHVTKVIQELLHFCAAYEEQVIAVTAAAD